MKDYQIIKIIGKGNQVMKVRKNENSWAPIVEDIDLRVATQDEINEIAKLCAKNSLVVIKGQTLTVADEIKIAKMFKNPAPLFPPSDPDSYHCCVADSENLIYRINAKPNEYGMVGIGGYPEEMTWHCDHAWVEKEQETILIWIYAVSGSKGSRTSWNNNILSYKHLDPEIKKLVDPLQGVFKRHREHKANDPHTGVPIEEWAFPIVRPTLTGEKGLFFPTLQFDHFVGLSKEENDRLFEILKDHTIKEEFLHHHDWEDGDIVISDQWYGMHKRWAFENIEERLCHRIWFGYPDQDYTK